MTKGPAVSKTSRERLTLRRVDTDVAQALNALERTIENIGPLDELGTEIDRDLYVTVLDQIRVARSEIVRKWRVTYDQIDSDQSC